MWFRPLAYEKVLQWHFSYEHNNQMCPWTVACSRVAEGGIEGSSFTSHLTQSTDCLAGVLMEPPVTVFQLNGHGSRIYKYWAPSKLNSYNLSVVLLFLFWRASLWFIVVTREIVFVISVSFSLTKQAMYVFQFTGPWFCMNYSYLNWLTKRTLMWYTEINRG